VSTTGPYHLNSDSLQKLGAIFGERLRKNVPLARFTAARIGGPADLLVEVGSVEELEILSRLLWQESLNFIVLGDGSNVLVSDAGVRGVVVVNRAKSVRFDESSEPPEVFAESGANLGVIARQSATRGLAGLEWAASIPGTLGGAVVGNAGAHGGDIAGSLLVADILHQYRGRETWNAEKLDYRYRSSALKHKRPPTGVPEAVVLSAKLRLERSSPEAVQAKLEEYAVHRRRTQPPGASMGSMFKNPPGDYAGRLIEAAGLKGYRYGNAQISTLHANFFINLEQASSADVYYLIQIAREAVSEKFGVELELEIELIGNWVTI
jgi:UDP-N-acetylmuramate dehydrogenase